MGCEILGEAEEEREAAAAAAAEKAGSKNVT